MSEAPKYNPSEIEKKWQDYWRKQGTYITGESSDNSFYILDMFPYPSGEGLHVGHPKGYIATDVYSRMKRMQGFDVLHPMGFDAFGLPAEQYAIKNKLNPRTATEKNVARYKEQLEILGLDYDWDREVNTTDPKFYKWTQWMWKQMYKDGLAYESFDPINWCPSCKTGLANEDLDGNVCERCGTLVEKKPLRQWTIRITDYADRLLADLDKLDWEPHIKELQRNWIGKSEGAEIDFAVQDFAQEKSLTVFTTRPDTLYGVTYLAVSAEKVQIWIDAGWSPSTEIRDFAATILAEQKVVQTDYRAEVEKKGIDTGLFAVHPGTGEMLPIWIANYVLSGYGTGVVMAVPAHDERDFEFASKYNLPIQGVINPVYVREDAKDKDTFIAKNKVVSIVEDQEGNILTVNWGPKLGGRLFLGGTIEEGETATQTAIRELAEETGYVDAEIVKVSDETFYYKYFAFSKNKAFDAQTKFVHIKLKTLKRIETQLEEDEIGKFEIEWVTKSIAEKEVVEVLHVYAFNKFVKNIIYSGYGILTNSAEFNGLTCEEAKLKIVEKVGGRVKSQYKLRDWVFARQRYWGEPFPIVFDDQHKSYAVADSELPVTLPDVENYEPTGTGESPLAAIEDWVNVYGYINREGDFESLDMSSFDFDKTEFMDINLGDGNDQYQSGAAIVERNNVACIIKHPTEEKYLISKWKASVWNGWMTGGIEDGDTAEETVRKEIVEETGYTDIKKVTVTDFSVHSLFYHPVKKQNRLAHYRLTIAELASLDSVPVSDDEQAICDFVWIDKKDVADTLTRDEMKSLWAKYIGSGEVYESKIKKFKRETNTMPQWAGSSWYYLRYIDPHNNEIFADTSQEKKWSPVDFYVGGAEHATRHLIYARFWHKYLFDKGLVSHDEPFKKLQTVGLILAEDGRKMSKRWGNVVNPDDVVAQYGADTLRLYEMFMGPFDQSAVWNTKSIVGSRRFLERVYALHARLGIGSVSTDTQRALHSTIKKVTEDIVAFKHNTAISALMTLQNVFEKAEVISLDVYKMYIQLLAPFAPHMTEELWQALGHNTSIHLSSWPVADESKLVSDVMTITVQVNGKLRGIVEVGTGTEKNTILLQAKSETNVSKWLEGKVIIKEIYVPNKLVNFVTEK